MREIYKEWFEKPIGIVVLNVLGSLIAALLIGYLLGEL